MNDVVLNFKITGDGKDGAAAVNEVVRALKAMGLESVNTGKKVEQSGNSFKSFANDAKGALRGLVGNALGALGASQFLAMGAAAIRAAGDLNDLATQTGATLEGLSVLSLAAEQTNVSMTIVRRSLRTLTTNLTEVKEGNVAAAKSFELIGLNAADLVDIPVDEAFVRVATALDNYQDGSEKIVVAQRLMGTSATQMLPIMGKLAGEGFAKVSAEAQRMGRIVTQETVVSADKLQRSMGDLRSQITAVSQSFFEGMIPSLDESVTALNSITGSTSGLRDVAETAGKIIGVVFKTVAGVLNEAATAITNVANTAIESAKALPGILSALARGQGTEALALVTMLNEQTNAFSRETKADARAFWRTLFGDKETIDEAAGAARDAAVLALAATIQELREAGKEVEDMDVGAMTTAQIKARQQELAKGLRSAIQLQAADLAQTLKAQSDARLAALARELSLVKERSAQFVAAATATFEQGRSSLDEFFAARREAIEREGDAERQAAEARVVELRRALQFQLDEGTIRAGGAEEATARKEIADAETAVQLTNLQLAGRRVALTDEETAKRRELQNAVTAFEATLAEQQGRVHAAAMLNIEQQAAEFGRQMTQAGLTADDVQRRVTAFTQSATTQANVAELQRQADLLAVSIQNNQDRLNNMVAEGTLTVDEATLAQNRFVASQQTAAAKLIEAMVTLKTGVSDPAVLAAIDGMINRLEGVETQAQGAQTQLELMGTSVLKAGGSALLGFLDAASERTFKFGDAFRSMALSVIQAIGDIAKQWLVLKAVQGIAGAFGLPAPQAFATGGPVPGRGTGDTVPAMLTPGEYVLTPRMVAEMGGTSRLEQFRRALRGGRSVVRGGVGYFAGGGPVQAMGTGVAGGSDPASEHKLLLDVSPDLVVRTLEGGAGGRAVVHAVKRNRNAIKDALGL